MLDETKTTSAVTALEPRAIAALSTYKTGAEALVERLGLPGVGRRMGNKLWNGPGSWLLLDQDAEALEAALGGAGAVTDQSDGLALIAVRGPQAVEILKQVLTIDVEMFGPNDVALTLAAHIGVKLWREEAGFVLASFRSFGGALYHALGEAEQNVLARG
jgi:sarcosine oxidase subunit gamma